MFSKVDRHEGSDTGDWASAAERGGRRETYLSVLSDTVRSVEVFQHGASN